MKRSFYIILGLAVLAALLVVSLLQGVVKPTRVVVASYDLAAGMRLTADVVELKEVPAGAVPEGAYTRIEDVEGKVLTTARATGDFITAYVAGDENAAAGIPAQLEPGHVAISVKVDMATGLAGVVRPGQRVAVIAVIDPQTISLNNFSAPVSAPLAVTMLATPNPEETPTPTPTPQPPLSPAARLTIHGLRVLVVPQSFRYEELPTSSGKNGQDALFAAARTTSASRSGSVILLEAPVEPVPIAAGYSASPAALLALLNKVATIHLVLEPAKGLDGVSIQAEAVDLAHLYEAATGLDLNQ